MYWNRDLETMDRLTLERLQLERLNATLGRAVRAPLLPQAHQTCPRKGLLGHRA